MQVNKEYRIIRGAYPYIAARLLTDPSEELQAALHKLLFQEDGAVRWGRLRALLHEATLAGDYDISLAADQLIAHLASDSGRDLRELLAREAVEGLDTLETETLQFVLQAVDEHGLDGPVGVVKIILNSDGRLRSVLDALADRVLAEVEAKAPADSLLQSARSAVQILRASKGHNQIGHISMIRKVTSKIVLLTSFVGCNYAHAFSPAQSDYS